MKRISPDTGPSDEPTPESPEGLAQAEEDRLLQMAVYGLTEDDFPDEAVDAPLPEDD